MDWRSRYADFLINLTRNKDGGMAKLGTSENRKAILALLKREGPMSARAIATALELHIKKVQKVIIGVRYDHPGVFFRIAEWHKKVDGHWGWMPSYSAEGGDDEPRTLQTEEERVEQKRLWHIKRRDAMHDERVQESIKTGKKLAPRRTPGSAVQRKKTIAQLYSTTPTKIIAAKTGLKEQTVRKIGQALGIKKNKLIVQSELQKTREAQQLWTPELSEILALMFPVMPRAAVAELLGMSIRQVGNEATKRKLEREKPPKKMRAPRPKKARVKKAKPKPAPVARKVKEVKEPGVNMRLPTKMTDAMIKRMAKERFEGTPERLARSPMFRESYVPTGMSYRGQVAR